MYNFKNSFFFQFIYLKIMINKFNTLSIFISLLVPILNVDDINNKQLITIHV